MSGDYNQGVSIGDGCSGKCLSNENDCLASRIDEFVERSNHWSRRSQLSDIENYSDGEINFAFEYVEGGGHEFANLVRRDRVVSPLKDGLAKCRFLRNRNRQIGNLFMKHFSGDLCVVYRWNKKLMLVEDIGIVDEEEKVVPTTFSMGLQFSDSTVKACPEMMGESITKNFIKPFCFSGKRKLNAIESAIPYGKQRRNDLPISMVESRSEIMDNIATDQCYFVYNGFVLFDARDALTVFGICLNNEDERSRFSQKSIKFLDVFCGPINLEKCAVCHG